MSDQWFEEFVYEVVVYKKYLTDEQKQIAQSEPEPLKPWDSIA